MTTMVAVKASDIPHQRGACGKGVGGRDEYAEVVGFMLFDVGCDEVSGLCIEALNWVSVCIQCGLTNIAAYSISIVPRTHVNVDELCFDALLSSFDELQRCNGFCCTMEAVHGIDYWLVATLD